MRILHYSLGLPPYRTGGMTKFCIDLILRQKEAGETVALLWPGKIPVLSKKIKIRKAKTGEIENFEILNPLPISLNGGIRQMEKYTSDCVNPSGYRRLFEEFQPDVIHIHTLMGLHKEFLTEAKKKGIKILFTSHDYFGICPKLTMFHNGAVCEDVEHCTQCTACNANALDMKKIILLQSPIYRKIKDWGPVRFLRKNMRERFFQEAHIAGNEKKETDRSRDYLELRKYYMDMLQMVDVYHFNSHMAQKIYNIYVPGIAKKGAVIPISHKDIKNNKKVKTFTGTVKITYLSPAIESKGYRMLIEVLDALWNRGEQWFTLYLYGRHTIHRPYAIIRPKYQYDELEKIFQNADVLAAPSIWYETFGYTVLEALSYGVPVLVTENVGAKDLLKGNEFGIVIKPEPESLKEAVLSLKDKKRLVRYNENIVNDFDVEENLKSYDKIMNLY